MMISRCFNWSLRSRLLRSRLLPLACASSCAAFASVGCATEDLSTSKLGNTTDLLVTVEEQAERISVIGDDGRIDPFLIGDWVGQAEDSFASADASGQRPTYTFPSGSSELRLRIDIENGATPVGALSFGSRAVPEPQAGVAFGADNNYFFATFQLGPPLTFSPIEGFRYRLWEGAPRLSLNGDDSPRYKAIGFSYAQNEPFESWCPLQPSSPTVDGGFSCAGGAEAGVSATSQGLSCTVSQLDGSDQVVDCDLLALCDVQGVCDCNETGCNSNFQGPEHMLWVAREGDQLIGHFSGAGFEYGDPGHLMPLGAIRFTRVMP